MKWQNKFWKAIFLPFLIGMLANITIISVILFKFSYKSIDEQNFASILKTELDVASIDIYSVNIMLSQIVSKIMLMFEEQTSVFTAISNSLDLKEEYFISSAVKNGWSLKKDFENTLQTSNVSWTGLWFTRDTETEFDHLTPTQKKQLITYSQMNHLWYSAFSILQPEVYSIYWWFEETDLLIIFSIKSAIEYSWLDSFEDFENPSWCFDSVNKKKPTYFYFRCRTWYLDMVETNSKNPNQTWFIQPPYNNLGHFDWITTICMKFIDPTSKGLRFICADVKVNDQFELWDRFNHKFKGEFLVTSVNNRNWFYYKDIIRKDSKMQIANYIFSKNSKYFLDEFITFNQEITPLFIKSYTYLIDDEAVETNNDPLVLFKSVNDSFLNRTTYSKNSDIFDFKIFPVIWHWNGEYQTFWNIIYIYQEYDFIKHMYSYQNGFEVKLYWEWLWFIFFGFILLLVVWMAMLSLAKYIVIPIKNVQYMLKGINIGGENRLQYWKSLKAQKETASTGNYFLRHGNTLREVKTITAKTVETKEEDDDKESNNWWYDNEKFDQEGDNIVKELHFYDFDEEWLQYRPKEVNGLVNCLLDLKQVLKLTSTSNNTFKGRELIINYSKSEYIFANVKNKEAKYICQSNIGNWTAINKQYDKAIYHLCLSLQDGKLKKFLSKTLSDELDVSDTLWHIIDMAYNKNFPKEISNKLVIKQQNATTRKYSQKAIGNLINNRYNKLIYFYFKFFLFLQKSSRRTEDWSGLYLHTNYHTINHFHKILVQYIYLCHVSSDLIKIGDSIWDYIEFLIKFKLYTKKKQTLYKDYVYYKSLQDNKRKIFEKIINWFDIFEHYNNHVIKNTTLASEKSIMEAYGNLRNDSSATGKNSSENNKLLNNSAFQFKVIIQRHFFWKGKFALLCKDYTDAITFFLESSKNKEIVIDGWIKKKSWKHLKKIALKLVHNIKKNNNIYNFPNKFFSTVATIDETYWQNRETFSTIPLGITNPEKGKNIQLNQEVILKFLSDIEKEINCFKVKQAKDIWIIVDRNDWGNEIRNKLWIEEFKYTTETKYWLNNYVAENDRFSMIIFDDVIRIVCPMARKIHIDVKQVMNYVDHISMKTLKDIEGELLEEYKKKFIDCVNYGVNYLQTKERENTEKYWIIYTDIFNFCAEIDLSKYKILKEVNTHLIICGKFSSNMNELEMEMIAGFGSKSEFVHSDNKKTIKTIWANTNSVNDNWTFSNEIYESYEK